MTPTVRDAKAEDLPTIVSLTRSQREQLATWSPVYFNPRQGADEGHGHFLAFLVGSDEHQTFVVEDDGAVVGFFVRIEQDRHTWLDDLCVDDQRRWPQVMPLVLAHLSSPWVTCVAAADRRRIEALTPAGSRRLSSYFVLAADGAVQPGSELVGLDGPADADDPGDLDNPGDPAPNGPEAATVSDRTTLADQTPAHTFGGRPFSPDLPGALSLTDGHGGYVIGSPSTSPPIYDPGGPTCVIDQIVGAVRVDLLDRAISDAAERGDAQIVVVCGADDAELEALLTDRGFTPEVLVHGR